MKPDHSIGAQPDLQEPKPPACNDSIKRKRIFFISPFTGRAGAEIYLYRFLKYFDKKILDVFVITEKHAPLFASLQPKITCLSMEEGVNGFKLNRGWNSLKRKFSRGEKISAFGLFVEFLHKRYQPEEWVLNTIIMHKMIPSAVRMGATTTTIIHEVPSAYSFVNAKGIQLLIEKSSRIIANSSCTLKAISIMGRKNAYLQPCFYDPDELPLKIAKAEIRRRLGIEPSDFVIIGSGSIDHNKGIELFMQISALSTGKSWKFIWLGGERGTGFNYYIHQYAKNLACNENLIFAGEKSSDYIEHMHIADLFLLTSFNESFSLVTLEALALGKPVLAYDCGGVTDFLKNGCGHIIETRNPSKWMESISLISENHQKYSASDIAASVAEYSAEKQVPLLTLHLAQPANTKS